MIDPDLMSKIRLRAYEIWQHEGCPQGRDRIHWVRAEAEFREHIRPRLMGSFDSGAASVK